MNPLAITFDVTAALPADVSDGRRVAIAAWLFWPDDLSLLGDRALTMTLLAGGSYDKRYFHVQVPGRAGYSAAEHLAARGTIVLLTDHLGVGASSRLTVQSKATRQICALANHAAVSQFYDRLARGTVHPDLPALGSFAKLGGGHSMGGKRQRAADFVPTGEVADYSQNDRAALHEGFHWDDVPAGVIAADDALAVETPAAIGLDSIRTRIVAADAARIAVPVYICLGKRDVSPDSHAEPSYYRASSDITLHILPRSGHCHNFAGTRHQLWERMHCWARCVAAG